ncbi:LysM peptidoglycan-binding domain-containing protein [Actinoplanes sp. NPDC026619]|uniref:LysM peptidoglycan-binding domain-containing protein n=1 Tax=Actinoplanes sp. NPDC026619 TaxID=3155798 RepID=UPI0033C724E5
MVAHDVRRVEPPLRLTRRGRAAVLVLLALMASLASAVLFTTASRADDQPAGALPTITVHEGDTLWDIAARVQPGRNGRDAVADLRRINHLTDSSLTPGQTLILPRT